MSPVDILKTIENVQKSLIKDYILDQIMINKGKWPAPSLNSQNAIQSQFGLTSEKAHGYIMEALDDWKRLAEAYSNKSV